MRSQNTISLSSDERGASEVIGYVIILGILIVTVGAVFTQGLPQLQQARDSENIQNTERGFLILQNNLEDISERGAPSRSTQIKLSEGALSINDSGNTWINVTIKNGTGTNICTACNTTIDPIVFSKENQKIVYEGGAVLRVSGVNIDKSQVVAYEPNWVFKKKGVVIPVVSTNGTGRVGGITTYNVGAREKERRSFTTDDINEISIKVKSERWKAWRQYFNSIKEKLDSRGVSTVSISENPSNNIVTITINNPSNKVKKIIYAKHVVDVKIT